MRAITQIPATFVYQSYMDGGVLERGLQPQALGAPIVDSLFGGQSQKREQQTPGVGLALHPASESPIAVRFKGGRADSSEVILTPGQQVRVGAFDSFEWGLPFGWLGGGTATLYVLHTPEAEVAFPPGGSASIVFHRFRTTIVTDFAQPVVNNWPGTFPWQNAVDPNGKPQGGGPIIPVSPDLVLLRLRSILVAPADLYLHFRGVDALDQDSTGVDDTTSDTIIPITFPVTPAGSGRPLVWLPAEVARLTCSAGGVHIVDPGDAAGLVGTGVEIVRYGRLG